MSLPEPVTRLNQAIDAWLTSPEPNAAGRLGLFRMLYAAFALWRLSFVVAEDIAAFPSSHRARLRVLALFPEALDPTLYLLLEPLLAGLLVLLFAGYRTRLVTGAVLVVGGVYEAWALAVNVERASVFVAAYLPLFMACNGRWGHTWSVDALLRRRAGAFVVDVHESSWRYFIPARATQVVLSALLLSAAVSKALGTWLEHPDLLANVLLRKNVNALLYGAPLNPLAPWLAEHAVAATALQASVLVAEAALAITLLQRRWLAASAASLVLFHATNALFLLVTFTPIAIVYALFIDWQALVERASSALRLPPRCVPSARVAASATGIAAALVACGWSTVPALRSAVQLGGIVDQRLFWAPLLPLALVWWLRAVATAGKRRVPA